MLLLDIILLRSLTLILLLYAADCYSGSAVRLSNDYQTIQATFFVLLATSCFASSCFSPFSFDFCGRFSSPRALTLSHNW